MLLVLILASMKKGMFAPLWVMTEIFKIADLTMVSNVLCPRDKTTKVLPRSQIADTNQGCVKTGWYDLLSICVTPSLYMK